MNFENNSLKNFCINITLRARSEYKPIGKLSLDNAMVKNLTDDDTGMFITEKNLDNSLKWIRFWDSNIENGCQVIVINSYNAFNTIMDMVIAGNGSVNVLKPGEHSVRRVAGKNPAWGMNTIFTHPIALKNLKKILAGFDTPLVHYCVIDPQVKMQTWKGKFVGSYFVDDVFTKHSIEILSTFGAKDMKPAFSLITLKKPMEVWTDTVAKSYGLNAWRFFNLENFNVLSLGAA